MKMLKFLPALCAGTALFGAVAPEATFVRLSAMPKPPAIDGKIAYNEWRYASTSFGGVSDKSGLLTRRENDFRFGYDAKNLYFAITSEMPILPQKLTGEDKVEFRIIPPGGKETTIVIDFEGKGTIPGGVTFKSGFAPALLNRFRNNCWTLEMAVPLATLGVSAIENGKEWKLQMMRHWSSDKETGFWHYTPQGKGNEYGIFVPDAKAPVISFDGFGHHGYEATGNYQWTYRIENQGTSPRKFHSDCKMFGINGAATLDINNPDLIGATQEHRIGYTQKEGFEVTSVPGKSAFFQLYLMAQFPGKPRLLASSISDTQTKEVYFQRSFFWDVNKAMTTACYQDHEGLPYFSCGFYPSYGNRFRYAATFDAKLPVVLVKFEVKNSAGKVIWKTTKADFGRELESFEAETKLPADLPPGDYTATMTSTGKDGRTFTHQRTFSLRKFAWHNQNIGKERVIIPPFKPLQLDKENQTVKALLTGYKQGQGLWSEIYAEGENILAAPVAFFFDGKPVIPGKAKLVSEEKDRIVYESTAQVDKVKFTFVMDYDYDGFCKVTVKAVPQGKVSVNDFGFAVSLKDHVVQLYDGLSKTGARAGNAPDLTIPRGEGELKLTGINPCSGAMMHYFWFGGVYKGFCWIIDSSRNCSFEPKKNSWSIARNNGAVTFRQNFVTRPTAWTKPMEWVIGFEPTPVKPRNDGYLQIGGYMYDYAPPKGGDHADMVGKSTMVPWLDYPINAVPNDDMSYYKLLFSSRNGHAPTPGQCREVADAYMARNSEWLTEHMPLLDQGLLYKSFSDKRQYGKKYFLHYQLPTLYSYKWPEAEMYKAEWLPWDYPVDDATNEYIANPTSEHTDFMLYFMREQARWGYDGMNFDTFPLGGAFNTVSGNGVRTFWSPAPRINNANMLRTASWGVTTGSMLFGWREMMKRTATMLYMEKKLPYGTPWVDLHTTESQVVPVTAFCSTILPWERGSDGGQYFDRFPEGFVLSDTLGTQSGCVCQPIVSTHSTKLPEAEQIKTLIAHSFAFGIMNHVDQGVTRNYQEYQLARDYVFTFGYGKPQNKTLFFYSREKQPVTCGIPSVHTTQVVRPDHKTLLLVGNTGKAVKAKFDLSRLNYKGIRLTDVYSGLALAEPVVDLEEHGYAMILVEEGTPRTAAEIAEHNRRIIGVESRYDKAEQMRYENPEFTVHCRNGVFTFSGSTHFWSKAPVKIEADRNYELYCDFRKTSDAKLNAPALAVVFYDENDVRIPATQYMTFPDTLTTLAAPVKAGDREALVRSVPGFSWPAGALAVLAFNAKADESDLPNAALSSDLASRKKEGDVIRVTFREPLKAAYPAGTSVRLHRSASFYQPVPENIWYNFLTREWKSAGGKIKIPHGVKAFRPAVIYYGPVQAGSFEMRNLRLVTK